MLIFLYFLLVQNFQNFTAFWGIPFSCSQTDSTFFSDFEHLFPIVLEKKVVQLLNNVFLHYVKNCPQFYFWKYLELLELFFPNLMFMVFPVPLWTTEFPAGSYSNSFPDSDWWTRFSLWTIIHILSKRMLKPFPWKNIQDFYDIFFFWTCVQSFSSPSVNVRISTRFMFKFFSRQW